MKRLNKILFFRFAFIGAALLLSAAFWYAMNWDRRPAFIQMEMAIFKQDYKGRGPGFTFGSGSVKGEADARILGWGYGWGLDGKAKAEFLWFCWTEPDGRIWFDISSDIKLTEHDIQLLTNSEWRNEVGPGYASLDGTRIQTPGYWRNNCSHETGELVCDKKEAMYFPLGRIKEQIPSISSMKIVEFLFSL